LTGEKLSISTESIKDRAFILGYPVDLVNMEDALDQAENFIKTTSGVQIVTLNPEMIMKALEHKDLNNALKSAELVIPDGSGIIIALKKMGIKNIKQIPGIEFSYSLIQRCVDKGYKIGFLGSKKEVLDIITRKFQSEYPLINIAFSHDGYFSEDEEVKIVEDLKTSGVQVLFVAFGAPKQELWISKYKSVLGSMIMVGVGGSFDVWAGKVKRAPLVFRKSGLEWFFRLITQPSRFKRMFPVLPLFFMKVLFDKKFDNR
jgi:N-acetylglucosaminyldiphosphoundecaprenol N-acetyl-beta-D-mannosaminyltransferase